MYTASERSNVVNAQIDSFSIPTRLKCVHIEYPPNTFLIYSTSNHVTVDVLNGEV